MPYFYLLMGPDEELGLACAELSALAGCRPDRRVAVGPIAVDVSRSAYIRLCSRQLASGADWSELRRAIAGLDLQCEDYRIEVFRPTPKVAVSATGLEKSIADLISGSPDLDCPRVEFAAVVTQQWWQFGPIISRSQQRWRRQTQRPYDHSHALPAQMARALVNLVAQPGEILLDPCCGSGTVVAEALADGINAWGLEINRALAQQAAANLDALGLPARILVGDAITVSGNFDAAVVDFPYGHSAPVRVGLYTDILLNLRGQVKRMALVFGCDQRQLLKRLGLPIIQQEQVAKGQLVRHIYVVAGEKGEKALR